MGATYDFSRNVVWVCLYWNRSILKVEIETLNATIYPMPWDIGQDYKGPLPWTLVLDDNGNLWIAIRSYMNSPSMPPNEIPYLAKLTPENNELTIYWTPVATGSGNDIKFNGYIWFLGVGAILKIDPLTEIIELFQLKERDGGFMSLDGSYIWITNTRSGTVQRFNTLTEKFDINLTGFDRPLGIEAKDLGYVYVAENTEGSTTSTIIRIRKSNLRMDKITLVDAPNGGTYYLMLDSRGNLWWTDQSNHIGYVTFPRLDIQVFTTQGRYGYFMTEVAFTSIWFSCVGSAYVGIIELPESTTSPQQRAGGGGTFPLAK
jgi:streptogramin lyase